MTNCRRPCSSGTYLGARSRNCSGSRAAQSTLSSVTWPSASIACKACIRCLLSATIRDLASIIGRSGAPCRGPSAVVLPVTIFPAARVVVERGAAVRWAPGDATLPPSPVVPRGGRSGGEVQHDLADDAAVEELLRPLGHFRPGRFDGDVRAQPPVSHQAHEPRQLRGGRAAG